MVIVGVFACFLFERTKLTNVCVCVCVCVCMFLKLWVHTNAFNSSPTPWNSLLLFSIPYFYLPCHSENSQTMDTFTHLLNPTTHVKLFQIHCPYSSMQNKSTKKNTISVSLLFSQHPLPTRRLYTWTPDGQHRNQIDYVLCSQRWRSSIQSEKNKTRSWLWLRSWTPYCQIQTEIEESRGNH